MSYRDDDDFDDYPAPRRGSGTLEKLLLVGAIGVLAWPAVKGVARAWRRRNPIASSEESIDESLKETFPASDPPAQRFVDVPTNRH
jgi:hypothetical protein